MIDIKKAELDDLMLIFPLVREYYMEDRNDVDMLEGDLLEHLANVLVTESCSVFYAVLDEEVAGVASMVANPVMGKVLAQEVFWKVASKYRKTKTGARLLTALEEEAGRAGATALTLVAIAGEHDKRVGNSYVSRGYEPLAHTYIKRLG
jgi:GNAT superfamily N-acetyltransferase